MKNLGGQLRPCMLGSLVAVPRQEEQNWNSDRPAPAGITNPPPDIRTIVDKTAQFVAKYGPEFELRMVAENAGNPKFDFLNCPHPYHSYYHHRLAQFRSVIRSICTGQFGG